MDWQQVLAAIRSRLGRGAADQMASRSAFLYNPPQIAIRPFELDYPQGAIADEAGKLRFDIDGRPFGRGVIVGRGAVGGAEEALPRTLYNTISEATTGQLPAYVAQSALGRDLGRVSVNPYTRRPTGIELSKSLTPQQLPNVYGHEIGHVIDQAAGEIPTQGLSKELSYIYNDINNPNLAQKRGLLGIDDVDISKAANLRNWTPKTAGYKSPADIQREYMSEAIRAYGADPNYMKTVAPKVAARIREHVNGNPWLRDIVQFNTLAPASAALGLIAAGGNDVQAAPTTGEAKADEYPKLERAADFLDKYIKTPIPLMEQPLGGTSQWLRDFGRDRPWQDRLSDAYGVAFDWLR